MKLLSFLFLIIFISFGCDKVSDPADSNDLQEEEHEQGEI